MDFAKLGMLIVNEGKNELVIKEYGELDKEILSLLCEETYAWDALKEAADAGQDALIKLLRTHNLYPPHSYIIRISDTVAALATGDLEKEDPQELHFDDLEQLSRDEAAMLVGDIEEESEDLDGLLEDETDDGSDASIKNKAATTSIKIADDVGGDAGGDA